MTSLAVGSHQRGHHRRRGVLGNDDDGTNSWRGLRLPLKPLREITVSPASLDFGDQDVDAGPSPSQIGDHQQRWSSMTCISLGISLIGADAAEFVIVSDSGETTLGPGGTRTVQVSFDPSNTGAQFGLLEHRVGRC